MPSHEPSLFTLSNKLMGLKGIDDSQEILHPALTWGVTPKNGHFYPDISSKCT